MLLNAHRIDSVPLILLVMEDITLRKQAEREKQRLLEQRKEFMAIASHELKTPITSLKGYTQLLHVRFVRAGDEGSAALLAKMDGQLGKLITLINELLDVTKIEAGQLAWHNEQFDLNALVRDLVEEVGYTTEQHQIRIEGAIPTSVFGDREHIGQVLINLFSNAMKYSPQANVILVKCAADADTATVGVQDFGIGIAPEKHEHVVERFFRVGDPEHETFPGIEAEAETPLLPAYLVTLDVETYPFWLGDRNSLQIFARAFREIGDVLWIGNAARAIVP